MSDRAAAGWDRPTTEADSRASGLDALGVSPTTERHLCSHHRATTERLSTYHANQLAAACPWCVDPSKTEPPWHNGVVFRHTSKPAVNLTAA